jgi:hypothetical protein
VSDPHLIHADPDRDLTQNVEDSDVPHPGCQSNAVSANPDPGLSVNKDLVIIMMNTLTSHNFLNSKWEASCPYLYKNE